MVACVLEAHWTIESTADRFQVDAKTVRKWRDRFLAEGADASKLNQPTTTRSRGDPAVQTLLPTLVVGRR